MAFDITTPKDLQKYREDRRKQLKADEAQREANALEQLDADSPAKLDSLGNVLNDEYAAPAPKKRTVKDRWGWMIELDENQELPPEEMPFIEGINARAAQG